MSSVKTLGRGYVDQFSRLEHLREVDWVVPAYAYGFVEETEVHGVDVLVSLVDEGQLEPIVLLNTSLMSTGRR